MPGAMPGLPIAVALSAASFTTMTDYIFKDIDSFHRLITMSGESQLAAQCKLPIGHWQCIFKNVDGIIYNANTDNTFTRIN